MTTSGVELQEPMTAERGAWGRRIRGIVLSLAARRGTMRDRTVRLIEYASLGAIFLVSLEATVRIEDRLRYGTPFLSPILSQNDLMLVDASGVHGRPEARYQKWAMNALGMRGPEVAAMKSATTIR